MTTVKKMFALTVLTLFPLLFFSSSVLAADQKLPAPRMEGGPGIFEALKARSSSPGDALSKPLSLEQLSTILWAASGLNRAEKGWTVPMAMGSAPYCRIYVADAHGVFLYDWADNILKEVSSADIRGKIGAQGFVKNAGQVLIIVADSKALSSYDKATAAELADVLTGAMSQNIYLASTGLGVGVRYVRSMKPDQISSALKLPEKDRPVCLMLLGQK